MDSKVVTYYRADISDQLAKIQRLNGAQANLASQGVAQMGKMSTAVDATSQKFDSLGKTANKALTAIKINTFIAAIGQARALITDYIAGVNAIADAVGFVAVNWKAVEQAQMDSLNAFQRDLATRMRAKGGGEGAGLNAVGMARTFALNPFSGLAGQPSPSRSGGPGTGPPVLSFEEANVYVANLTDPSGRAPRVAGDAFSGSLGAMSNLPGASRDLLTVEERYANFQARQGDGGMLERTFGPIEDFNAYATGFDMLRGATEQAFASWADGSKSMGEAFKAAIRQSLIALSADMAGRALQAGAMAVYSLATGNLAGAAAYGKSAGLFAAGAVAVGGLARNLGGGGGAPSGAGAPNFAGGGGGGGGSSVTVILGDDWADESAQSRQRRARKTIDRALRDGAGNEGGIYRG